MSRNRGGIRKEGAQKPDRAELNGKSQTVVVAAVSRDHLAVSVVQMEIASELTGRRMIRIAPIAAVLVLTQELDRHTVPCRGVKRPFGSVNTQDETQPVPYPDSVRFNARKHFP